MMCLLNLSDIGLDSILLDTINNVKSRIYSMRKRIFSRRNRGQMVMLGLSILELFSFDLNLFYNIQIFLLFFILLFLKLYLCSNLMMLLFKLAMVIKLVFSKFNCFLLKIKGNLIKNLSLLMLKSHQNFKLRIDNLFDKFKARFIYRFFHLIKCIPKF